MCGIAGFWLVRPGQGPARETLQRMGAALAHRGPDDYGVFQEEAAGIGLAFRRLSILDLSAEARQPMFSASGRYVIVFNGEIYNYEEIRKELGSHSWRGHSDTEVMLAAIERWGVESSLQRFVGMFAFALWDRQERSLSLVRDRLGIKPLYYGRIGQDVVFASELKAFREHPDFAGRIDRDVLALYLRHNYIPSPHCIYQGFYKLRPGCILTLGSALQEFSPRSFWSAQEVAREGIRSPFSGSDAEAIEQLQEKLATAVRLRMIADVPLGAFLSGGVDSSAIVAVMQAQSRRPVKTFTIGFQEDHYNEAAHARRVADHLGTDHTELCLTGKDALEVVPLLPAMFDEPFADPSQIPTYMVSQLARKRVTVGLSGDGGDELFGGYRRYEVARSIWNIVKKLPRGTRTTAAKVLEAIPENAMDHAFQVLQPVLPDRLHDHPGRKAHTLARFMRSSASRADIYRRALSHWDDPSSVVAHAQEPRTVMDSFSSASAVGNFEESMMLTDLINYLPDDVLTKVDRASMAVSLEARVPLLDHRLVEFAWKLPLRFKMRNGTSKWILRQILYKYVPQELIDRPKMGFSVPIESWLRGPLRDWAEDLLSENSLNRHGYFHAAPIRSKWKEHISGAQDWQDLLWDILVFQDWHAHTSQLGTAHRPAPVTTDG